MDTLRAPETLSIAVYNRGLGVETKGTGGVAQEADMGMGVDVHVTAHHSGAYDVCACSRCICFCAAHLLAGALAFHRRRGQAQRQRRRRRRVNIDLVRSLTPPPRSSDSYGSRRTAAHLSKAGTTTVAVIQTGINEDISQYVLTEAGYSSCSPCAALIRF